MSGAGRPSPTLLQAEPARARRTESHRRLVVGLWPLHDMHSARTSGDGETGRRGSGEAVLVENELLTRPPRLLTVKVAEKKSNVVRPMGGARGEGLGDGGGGEGGCPGFGGGGEGSGGGGGGLGLGGGGEGEGGGGGA